MECVRYAQTVGLWERHRKTLANLCLRREQGERLMDFIVTLTGITIEQSMPGNCSAWGRRWI